VLALLILAALVTTGPTWRRALGLALALALVLWPLAVDAPPLIRGLLALFTFWGAGRVLDLARDPRAYPAPRRVAHVLAVVDTRQLTRVPPALDRRALLAGAAWLAVSVFALRHAEHSHAWPLARWSLGALFVYGAAEAANNLLLTALSAVGLRTPPLHRRPIAARSLREFWGERWNLTVHRWLRAHFFLPFARRRRPRLGLGLAFLASAGLHAWAAGVALGPWMAASMGAFFLLQALLIGLEIAIGVDRWPEPAAWAWTMTTILAPSPLFTEPLLRAFEGGAVLV
jgi:hypothetical protein